MSDTSLVTKRTILPLPLHCYDQQGKVLPPRWLFWLTIFGARYLLILLFLPFLEKFSATVAAQLEVGSELFYFKLINSLAFIAVYSLVSWRHKLHDRGVGLKWIKLVLVVLLFFDIGFLFLQLAKTGFAFDGLAGISMLIALSLCFSVVKSRHVRLLQRDWQAPD
jgi:hypothetical protein